MTKFANKDFLDVAAHRRLWRLAAPMMLSNVSIATLGLVDTAVIGHLDNASYLAGIAIASVLFDFLYWGVTFLRMGTTGVVAQGQGADDVHAVRRTLRDALCVGLTLSVLMLVLRNEVASFGFALIGGSDVATNHALGFFQIKIWGAPGVLVTMVCVGWLIGMQNARAAMWLAAGPCLLHAALDVFLVVILELGIEGAAYAALVTAGFSACFGILLVRLELKRHPRTESIGWHWDGIKRLLVLNSNILLRTLCLIGIFAFFTRQGALQGDNILAANAVLLNFQMLTALALDGFANALEALVGASIGASDRARFFVVNAIALFWSLLCATVFAIFYFFWGGGLIALLTDIPSVKVAAERYLIWAAISPLISVWCFVFDGIFIGATKGREMRNSMIFSAFGVFLPCWYFLQGFGNHGLWLAFLIFFAARGFSMAWYYYHIDKRNAWC